MNLYPKMLIILRNSIYYHEKASELSHPLPSPNLNSQEILTWVF